MAILSRPVSQVFINFRGKDLRVSHLIDALERHNIQFFVDTDEQKGRDLKHLFKRIEEAPVALVVLSTVLELCVQYKCWLDYEAIYYYSH